MLLLLILIARSIRTSMFFVWKELPHGMHKGSLQQECYACSDRNVNSVIFVSTGSVLLCLHFAFNFCPLTI